MTDKTQALAIKHQQTEISLTGDEIKSLIAVGVIPEACPEPVISLYAKICSETGLSPFKRQIYIVKRWTKQGERFTTQTGIDGYRAIAESTDQYAGSDDAIYDNELQPRRATVTVYKMVSGQRCPFTATARWDQYYPGDKQGFMWNKMPHLMLAKCAEALALRKAFPGKLSGIYTTEEMQQADVQDQTLSAKPVVAASSERNLELPPAAPEPQAHSDGKARTIAMLQSFRKLGVGHKDIAGYLMIDQVVDLDDNQMAHMKDIYVRMVKESATWAECVDNAALPKREPKDKE